VDGDGFGKMMAEWDREGQLATAIMTGKEEGRAETARAMKDEGIPLSVIAKCTGLTEKQMSAL